MTVEPGFGGQQLLHSCLAKIEQLRASKKTVQVDGGVNADNIAEVSRRGASVIVAGSAVFAAEDPAQALRRLQSLSQQ